MLPSFPHFRSDFLSSTRTIKSPLLTDFKYSAGGGGNTQDRRNKIEEKNSKLNEQRIRRLQEEEKAKWEKKKDQPADASGIHPSRRGIVPGA